MRLLWLTPSLFKLLYRSEKVLLRRTLTGENFTGFLWTRTFRCPASVRSTLSDAWGEVESATVEAFCLPLFISLDFTFFLAFGR
jgi:hypothetical protein